MSLNTCTIIVLLLKRIKDSQYASQWFPFCHCFSQYLVSLAGAPCDPYMQLLACSVACLPYLHSAVFLLRWFFVYHSGKNWCLECWCLRGEENWSTQIKTSQSKRARTNNRFNQQVYMYGTTSRTCTLAILVGRELSHTPPHCLSSLFLIIAGDNRSLQPILGQRHSFTVQRSFS